MDRESDREWGGFRAEKDSNQRSSNPRHNPKTTPPPTPTKKWGLGRLLLYTVIALFIVVAASALNTAITSTIEYLFKFEGHQIIGKWVYSGIIIFLCFIVIIVMEYVVA